MNISSSLLENAVSEFSKMPGIGRRGALRLVLHLLKQQQKDVFRFTDSLRTLCQDIRICKECNNISDFEICTICSDHKRDDSTICVVEDIRDILAIENTQQYFGKYHVLGGIISPMDGIGPDDLQMQSLFDKLQSKPVKEIILALPATMEGDTTIFYLHKKICALVGDQIKFSTIARGIAIGDQLEYADEVTLGRSILHRIPYENALTKQKV